VIVVVANYLYGTIKTKSHYAPGSQMGFYQLPKCDRFNVWLTKWEWHGKMVWLNKNHECVLRTSGK